MTNETYKDNLELINDFRKDLGLSTFDTLTEEEMTEQLKRIEFIKKMQPLKCLFGLSEEE